MTKAHAGTAPRIGSGEAHSRGGRRLTVEPEGNQLPGGSLTSPLQPQTRASEDGAAISPARRLSRGVGLDAAFPTRSSGLMH